MNVIDSQYFEKRDAGGKSHRTFRHPVMGSLHPALGSRDTDVAALILAPPICIPAPLAAGFREFQIQIGIKIVKLPAPVSTALNQIRRLAFLSMILSESRFPLFGIMLQHPVAFRSSLKRVLQCLSNFGERLLSARVRESKTDGRSVMAAAVSDYLPHQNPCAQCGHPIAAPVWFEHEPRRTTYLWQCASCGYRFEAVAFFAESKGEPNAIAA